MQPVSTYNIPTYTGNDGQPFPHGTSGPAPGPAATAVPLNTTGVLVVDRYQHKHSTRLGIIQVIIGFACIFFNAVALGIRQKAEVFGLSPVGYGFWMGLTFISAGGLGIAAGKNRTKCTIIGFMVMSIISAAFTAIMFSLGIAGALIASSEGEQQCSYLYYNYRTQYTPSRRPDCSEYPGVVAMEAFLAIAGIFEAIVAIWGAVICCKSGVCCCSSPQQTMMLPVGYYPNNGQVMFVHHTQGVQMIYPQPQVTVPFQQGLMVPPVTYQAGYAAPPTWNSQGGLPGNTPQGQIMSPPPYQTNTRLFQQPPGQEEKC